MNEAKNQVSKMKTIDELNRELDEKLALIRAVRYGNTKNCMVM